MPNLSSCSPRLALILDSTTLSARPYPNGVAPLAPPRVAPADELVRSVADEIGSTHAF